MINQNINETAKGKSADGVPKIIDRHVKTILKYLQDSEYRNERNDKGKSKQSQREAFYILSSAYLKISDALVKIYLHTLALRMSSKQPEIKIIGSFVEEKKPACKNVFVRSQRKKIG